MSRGHLSPRFRVFGTAGSRRALSKSDSTELPPEPPLVKSAWESLSWSKSVIWYAAAMSFFSFPSSSSGFLEPP